MYPIAEIFPFVSSVVRGNLGNYSKPRRNFDTVLCRKIWGFFCTLPHEILLNIAKVMKRKSVNPIMLTTWLATFMREYKSLMLTFIVFYRLLQLQIRFQRNLRNITKMRLINIMDLEYTDANLPVDRRELKSQFVKTHEGESETQYRMTPIRIDLWGRLRLKKVRSLMSWSLSRKNLIRWTGPRKQNQYVEPWYHTKHLGSKDEWSQ